MSTTTSRFQMDLTQVDLQMIDRLATLAGLKTKKELLMNAVTLFKWAAQEALYGRSVCSISDTDGRVRQLELPALSAIVERAQLDASRADADAERRATEPRSSLPDILAALKETSMHAVTSGSQD